MHLDRVEQLDQWPWRWLICMVATLTVLLSTVASSVSADPASDALARLNELSRAAEQTTEAMHSAQLDLDAKLAAQRAADERKAAAEVALESVKTELVRYQAAVDKVGDVHGWSSRWGDGGIDRRLAATSDRPAHRRTHDGHRDG